MLCNPSVHINKKVIFLVPYFDEANIVNTDVIFSTTPVQEFGFKVLEKTKNRKIPCIGFSDQCSPKELVVSLFGNMKEKMRTANNIRRQNPNNFSDTEARASSLQSSLSSQFTFGLLLIRTKTRMTASSIRTGTIELPFEKDKHAFG